MNPHWYLKEQLKANPEAEVVMLTRSQVEALIREHEEATSK